MATQELIVEKTSNRCGSRIWPEADAHSVAHKLLTDATSRIGCIAVEVTSCESRVAA
jgi:hypothetical protein